MKNQALFSLKDKSKKIICRLLQFLFGVLRINISLSLTSDLCLVISLPQNDSLHEGHYNIGILKPSTNLCI